MKKVAFKLLIFLAILLLIGGGFFSSHASIIKVNANESETGGDCGDTANWYFNIETGSLSITGSGAMNEYSEQDIPWISYVGDITSVQIDDGITSISQYSFKNCINISSIAIPSSVTAIGKQAFFGCTDLENIDLSEGITTIGELAFYNCSSLTSLQIPNTLRQIGAEAFSYCTGLNAVHISSLESWLSIGFISDFSNPLEYAHNLYLNGELVSDVTIPETISTIYQNAFRGCTSLTRVTMGNTVTSIGSYAFYGCTNLTSIILSSKLTRLNSFVFADCISLRTINLPGTMQTIDGYAFYGCESLRSINFTGNLREIGSYAFSGCKQLTTVTLLTNTTTIGHHAFENCESIRTITIQGNATIGEAAFSGCSSLTSLRMPIVTTSSNTNNNFGYIFGTENFKDAVSITHINGKTYFIPSTLKQVYITNTKTIPSAYFYNCTPIESINLPSTLTTIDTYAFYNCNSIKSLTIPDSVTTINANAFYNCRSIKDITISNNTTSIASNAFSGCQIENATIPAIAARLIRNNNLKLVQITSGTSIDDGAFSGCTNLVIVTIADTVTSIGTQAFYGCESLGHVTLSNNITTISSYMFAYCTSLESINIPNRVTTISDRAFSHCSSLASLTLPSQITTIGAYAFEYCSSLEAISLIGNITTIDSGTFAYCTNLAEVRFSSRISTIKSYAFQNCSSLEELSFPNSVRAIENGAFYNCSSLRKVTFADYVRIENSNAFGKCPIEEAIIPSAVALAVNNKALKTVTIIKGTEIVAGSFKDCSSLESIIIPDSITTISDAAFLDCTSIKSIIIPSSVTSIANTAFAGCKIEEVSAHASFAKFFNTRFLKSYEITGGTRIDDVAFYCCSSLVSITIPNTIERIGQGAFSGCTKLANITIPNSVTSIGNYAFLSCPIESATVPAFATVYIKNTSLKSVIVISGTAIPQNAFNGCRNLEEVILPTTIRTIGSNAFKNCDAMKSLCVASDFSSSEISTLYQNDGFVLYYYERTTVWESEPCNKSIVYEVSDNGFYYINSSGSGVKYDKEDDHFVATGYMRSVSTETQYDIEVSGYVYYDYGFYRVTRIADEAFHRMNYIKSVVIGNNIETIGKRAFYGTGLQSITIPYNVITIDEEAFAENSSLKNASIGNGVTTIGKKAFYGTGLTKLSLGRNVQFIDDLAFAQCNSLRWIVFVGEVPTIGENIFSLSSDGIKTSIYYNNEAKTWTEDKGNNIVGWDTDNGWITAYVRAGNLKINPNYKCDIDVLNHGEIVYLDEFGIDFYGNKFRCDNSTLTATLIEVDLNSNIFGTSIVIPNTVFFGINKYTVNALGDGVFSNLSNLRNLVINDNIESIGASAFAGCENLKSVVIGNGVTSIGASAFADCTNLAELILGESVQTIGDRAFYRCRRLTKVSFGASVDSIGSQAFYGCTGLTELCFFGDKPQGTDCFSSSNTNCIIVRLDTASNWGSTEYGMPVFICASTTNDSIGSKDAQGVYYSEVPGKDYAIVGYQVSTTTEEETRWEFVQDNFEYNNNGLGFNQLNELNTNATGYFGNESVTIADFVLIDGKMYCVVGLDIYAFFGSNVKSITLGKFIGSEADTVGIPSTSLRHTRYLQNIVVDSDNEEYMSIDGVLYTNLIMVNDQLTPTMLMKLPSAKYLPNGRLDLNNELTQNVVAIDYYACSENLSLSFINLYHVQHIYGFAFSNCSSLKVVEFGNTVYICDGAFYNCSMLDSISLPEYVKEIGEKAFFNCIKLQSVEIDGNIEVIGDQAFAYCNDLVMFNVQGSDNYFSDNDVLYSRSGEDIHLMQYPASKKDTSFTVKEGTTHIDSLAFYYAQYLSSIELSDSVKYVGDYAFNHCSSLRTIKLGKNVAPVSIGGAQTRMFIDCLSMIAIEVDPENPYYFSDGGVLYQYKYTYDEATLEASIDTEALILVAYPTGLQRANYTIPDKVVYIASAAFYNNPFIQRIVLLCDNVEIMDEVFFGCSSLKEVVFKCEVPKQVGEGVFPKDNDGKQTCEILFHQSKTSWKEVAIGNENIGFMWMPNSNNAYIIQEYNAIEELENLHGDNRTYIIIVVDSNGNPIKDASIEVNNTLFENHLTASDGSYAFEYELGWLIDVEALLNGEGIVNPGVNVKISKDGYFTYDNILYLDQSMLITYITLAKEPTVRGISVCDHDINSQMININIADYKSNDYLTFVAEGYSDVESGQYIYYYAIVQNGKVISEKESKYGFNYGSDDGVARLSIDVELNKFYMDVPVQLLMKVRGYDDATQEFYELEPLQTNMYIELFKFTVNENNFDWIKGIASLDIPDWVPYLGTKKIDIEIPNCPVKVSVKDDTATISIGITKEWDMNNTADLYGALTDISNGSLSGEQLSFMEALNKSFNKFDKAADLLEQAINDRNKFYGVSEIAKKGKLELFIGGVAELKYVNGRPVVTKGMLQGTLKYKFTMNQTVIVWIVPVHFELELNVKGELTLTLYEMSYDEEVNFWKQFAPKLDFNFQVIVTFRGGVGCSVVSLGVYGKLGIKVDIELAPNIGLKKATLITDFGWYFKYNGLFVKYYYEWSALKHLHNQNAKEYDGEFVIYDRDGSRSISTRSLDAAYDLLDEIDDYQNSLYLSSNYKLVTASEANDGEVYKNIEPVMAVDANGNIIMVYVDNVQSYDTEFAYDEYNYQKLVYRVYKQNDTGDWYWTTPKLIVDNGLADGEFTLREIDGAIYLAYTQANRKLTAEDEYDVANALSEFEVWYSSFNSLTNEFEHHTKLTNDKYYDFNLNIEKYNQSIIVSWVKNTENSMNGMSIYNYTYSEDEEDSLSGDIVVYETTANSINYAVINNNELTMVQTAASGLGPVVDLVINNNCVYYIIDEDCSLKTTSDRTIYQLTVASNVVINELLKNVETEQLALFDDCAYVLLDNEWISLVDKGTSLFGKKENIVLNKGEFLSITDSNDLDAIYLFVDAVNWVDENDSNDKNKDGSVIFAIPCTNGVWGDAIKLFTETDAVYIDNFDAVWFNGKLYIVYLETYNATNEEEQTYRLKFYKYDFDSSVEIESVFVEKDDNGVEKLNIKVTNNGILPISELNIDVVSPNGDVYQELVSVNILGGQTVELQSSYAINTPLDGKYVVSAYLQEEDKSSASIRLAYSDLFVNGKYVCIGEQNMLVVSVINYGLLPTEGTLYVFAGAYDHTDAPLGDALYKLAFGTIECGQRKYFSIAIDEEFYTEYKDAGIISLIAIPAVVDENEADNAISIVVCEPSSEEVDVKNLRSNIFLSEYDIDIDADAIADVTFDVIGDDGQVVVISDNNNVLELDRDYVITSNELEGTKITLSSSYLSTLPLGKTVLVVNIGDVTRNVTLTSSNSKYSVKWHVNGQVVEQILDKDATPKYSGEIEEASTVEYTDVFVGWSLSEDDTTNYSLELPAVTANVDYYAVFERVAKQYTITWVVGNRVSHELYTYGTMPVFNGKTDKAASGEYIYIFTGWDQEITTCTGDKTYTAMYNEVSATLVVKFVDIDGTVISTADYHYGDKVNVPAAPTKPSDSTYSYAFSGWDKEVVDCTEDATYVATYEATFIEYTVTFKNYDGSTISSRTYHYGDTVEEPIAERPSDKTNTYEFNGWDQEVTTVTSNSVYTATYTSTLIDYTVLFVDYDGTVISSTVYHNGDQVTIPNVPARKADAACTYEFNGWDKEVTNCNGNATYTATYNETFIDYVVTFKNYNNSIISINTYHYGDTVVVPPTPNKLSDNTYSYVFSGWDKEVTSCQEDITYTAVFDANYIDYVIRFVNADGKEISQATYHYDDLVVVPADPTKPSDMMYNYTFTGWDKTVEKVSSDATYTALYSSSYIEYTISFVDYDGRVIATTKYHYDDEVSIPTNPSRASDNTYTYSFKAWDKLVEKVASDATYVATYDATFIYYVVEFRNYDGTVLSTNTYHYGDQVVEPVAPEKPSTDTYDYEFVGWDHPISSCDGNKVYTAVFNQNENKQYMSSRVLNTLTDLIDSINNVNLDTYQVIASIKEQSSALLDADKIVLNARLQSLITQYTNLVKSINEEYKATEEMENNFFTAVLEMVTYFAVVDLEDLSQRRWFL